MTEAVVFDTNVLPLAGSLDNSLWLSIRKLCETLGVQVALPEIVVHESVNLRREMYTAASAAFLESYRAVERFFDAQPVYVPDADEICRTWEEELREAFVIVPVHGDDAVSALEREALRTRPARDGRGARDSAIWMTVLRLAQTHDKVSFVSRNTADFATGKAGALHPDLSRDIADVPGEVIYLSSVDAFIGSLAASVESPTLTVEQVSDAIGFDIFDGVHAAATRDPRFEGISPDELSEMGIRLTTARALRTYAIGEEGGRISLIQASGVVTGVTKDDSNVARFTCTAWMNLDDEESDLLPAGEIQFLDLLD